MAVNPAVFSPLSPLAVPSLLKPLLAALHPGAIVIMHDGGGNRSQTVAALPAIIAGIRAAGYQIVPACAGLAPWCW